MPQSTTVFLVKLSDRSCGERGLRNSVSCVLTDAMDKHLVSHTAHLVCLERRAGKLCEYLKLTGFGSQEIDQLRLSMSANLFKGYCA